jgi:uncharacterized protein (DUF2147 family)
MKAFLFGAMSIAFFISNAFAEDITGTWRYIDDKTGEAKGLVKIEKQSNGTYSGTALKATPRPGYTPKEFCTNCPAPYTNKPIIGLQVISGLKTDDHVNFTDGKIIDPVSGKIYRLKGKLSPNGKKLFLRGYLGISVVGRSQTWLRIE